MWRKRVPSSEQPTQPVFPVIKREPIWIHPHQKSFKRNVRKERKRKVDINAIKFAFDLLGVGLALIFLFLGSRYIVANTNVQTKTALEPDPHPGSCVFCSPTAEIEKKPSAVAVKRNARVEATASSVALKPTSTPHPDPDIPAMPTAEVQPGQVAVTASPSVTQTPTINATPTQVSGMKRAALSSDPETIDVSYSHVCQSGGSIPINLKNMGDHVLLWAQDQNSSDPGLILSDPVQLYLLKPGREVTVSFRCSAVNIVGQYKIELFYNGGILQIPVQITA